MDIILESNILMVKNIKKKTKAKLFKDLEVGDLIKLSIPVKAPGVSLSNDCTYASYITVKNLKNDNTTNKSFNEIVKFLRCFEFEKITSWQVYSIVIYYNWGDKKWNFLRL